MFQPPSLDRALLLDLFRLNASLGLYPLLKGIDYVRSIELPTIAAELLRSSPNSMAYLDVGAGASILPVFVAARSQFTVTAIDKFDWVHTQLRYLRKLGKQEWLASGRFAIHQRDFLKPDTLSEESFDLVTAVSVLEHMNGDGDSDAVAKIFRLLRPGGRLLLSSPYNHARPADYVVRRAVYGEEPGTRGAFFQRHYSAETLQNRLLNAAPFLVEKVFYAGHYHRPNVFKMFYLLPMPLKPVKVLYNWAAPLYAPHFLRLSDVPPSDPRPRMITADTVFVFLRKPA